MDPDGPAAIDAVDFGGYTALFSTVVSQRNFRVNYGKGQPDEARFTRLLRGRGPRRTFGRPSGHASRTDTAADRFREYRDVTPLGWGERFDAKVFVSRESLRLIEARGGGRIRSLPGTGVD